MKQPFLAATLATLEQLLSHPRVQKEEDPAAKAIAMFCVAREQGVAVEGLEVCADSRSAAVNPETVDNKTLQKVAQIYYDVRNSPFSPPIHPGTAEHRRLVQLASRLKKVYETAMLSEKGVKFSAFCKFAFEAMIQFAGGRVNLASIYNETSFQSMLSDLKKWLIVQADPTPELTEALLINVAHTLCLDTIKTDIDIRYKALRSVELFKMARSGKEGQQISDYKSMMPLWVRAQAEDYQGMHDIYFEDGQGYKHLVRDFMGFMWGGGKAEETNNAIVRYKKLVNEIKSQKVRI